MIMKDFNLYILMKYCAAFAVTLTGIVSDSSYNYCSKIIFYESKKQKNRRDCRYYILQ